MTAWVLCTWISKSFYSSRWQGRGARPYLYIHITGSITSCWWYFKEIEAAWSFYLVIWSDCFSWFQDTLRYFLFLIGSVLRRHVELIDLLFLWCSTEIVFWGIWISLFLHMRKVMVSNSWKYRLCTIEAVYGNRNFPEGLSCRQIRF